MSRSKIIKVGLYLLIILIFIVISFQYYQEVKEEERQFKTFLNHFYFSVDKSIVRIDRLIEKQPRGDELDESIHELERKLLEADTILSNGRSFLDNEIYKTRFFLESTYFLYGFRMIGTDSFEVTALGEDGQLDEEELNLLRTIRKYLAKTKEEMYSSQTKQENPNLTIDEFNEIIRRNLNKRPEEVYKESHIETNKNE